MSDADGHHPDQHHPNQRDPIAERVAALTAMLKEYERATNGFPQKPRNLAKDPSTFVVMSVKARRAEIEEFKAVCARLGAPPNRAMRALIREASGYIELHDEDRTGILELERQLRTIAATGERIAQVAQETGRPDAAELDQWRRDVDAKLGELRSAMRTILNVAASRADGMKCLSRSVAALEKANPSQRGKNQKGKVKGSDRTRPELASSAADAVQDATTAPTDDVLPSEAEPNAEPSRTGFKLRRPPYPYVHPNKRR